MTDGRRVSIELWQDHKCVLLSSPQERKPILILFLGKDEKKAFTALMTAYIPFI